MDESHLYKFMWCKHAQTYVLICGKGKRLKIHKWGNKYRVSVKLYMNNEKIKTYVVKSTNAKQFWQFLNQLHKNFLYSKKYFKKIRDKNVMINLYNQLFDDILAMVKYYANENCKDG